MLMKWWAVGESRSLSLEGLHRLRRKKYKQWDYKATVSRDTGEKHRAGTQCLSAMISLTLSSYILKAGHEGTPHTHIPKFPDHLTPYQLKLEAFQFNVRVLALPRSI